jgi:hypothetical protein
MKYIFWIIHVSQLSVQPPPPPAPVTITPDNRVYTIVSYRLFTLLFTIMEKKPHFLITEPIISEFFFSLVKAKLPTTTLLIPSVHIIMKLTAKFALNYTIFCSHETIHNMQPRYVFKKHYCTVRIHFLNSHREVNTEKVKVSQTLLFRSYSSRFGQFNAVSCTSRLIIHMDSHSALTLCVTGR